MHIEQNCSLCKFDKLNWLGILLTAHDVALFGESCEAMVRYSGGVPQKKNHGFPFDVNIYSMPGL